MLGLAWSGWPPPALEQVRGISPLCGAINVPLLERINMKTGAIVIGIKFSPTEKNRIGSRDRSIQNTRTCSQTSKPYNFVSSLHLPLFPGAPSAPSTHSACRSCRSAPCCAASPPYAPCWRQGSFFLWDFQRHLVELGKTETVALI